MAQLYASSRKPLTLYRDRKYHGDQREREQTLSMSKTLYVGNLSFYTSEEQIFDVFSKVGEIKRIIMGLDRLRKTPCGFCFVEYFMRADAEKSVQFLSGTKLDERQIRVDYDIGFAEGRQYGRGKSGGQVRDEHRVSYDPGRGGYGKAAYRGMTGMEMWGYNSGPQPSQFHPGSRDMTGYRGGGGGGGGGGSGGGRFRGRGPRDRARRRSFPGRFQPVMQQSYAPPPMFIPPVQPNFAYRRARSFNDAMEFDQPYKRMRQDGQHAAPPRAEQGNENADEPMRNERLERGREEE